MKRFGMWARVFAIWGVIFLSGCGGDDDDPSFFSPASLRGRTFTLSGDQGPSSITFAESGNAYSITRPDNQTAAVGTYQARRNGNNWEVLITTPDRVFTSQLVLRYAAPGRGKYTFVEPGWQQVVSGIFEEIAFAGNPDPGQTTTGTTTTGGPGGTPVAAPAALKQIVMTGDTSNPSGRGPFTFQLIGTTVGTFTDGLRTGNFTYTPLPGGATTAILNLQYTGAQAGDFGNYTLSFQSGNRGTFAGTEKFGATQSAANGTFEYTTP